MKRTQIFLDPIRSWLIRIAESKKLPSALIGLFATIIILSGGDISKIGPSIFGGFLVYFGALMLFKHPKSALIAYSNIALFLMAMNYGLFVQDPSLAPAFAFLQIFLVNFINRNIEKFWPTKKEKKEDECVYVGPYSERDWALEQWVDLLCRLPTKDEERKRTWEDEENQLRFMTTSGFTHSDSHLDQQQIKNKENAKKVLELATKLRKQDWQGMRIDK